MMKIHFIFQEKLVPQGVARVSLREEKQSEILLLPSGEKEIRIGLGEKKNWGRKKFFLAVRQIIFLAKNSRTKTILFDFGIFSPHQSQWGMSLLEMGEALGLNFEI